MPNRYNWKMRHKTLTLADTEYSQLLTAAPVFLGVSAQSLVDIRISFTSGGTADGTGLYKTVFGGSQWESRGLIPITAKTIYMRCKSSAGVVVEIEEWT